MRSPCVHNKIDIDSLGWFLYKYSPLMQDLSFKRYLKKNCTRNFTKDFKYSLTLNLQTHHMCLNVKEITTGNRQDVFISIFVTILSEKLIVIFNTCPGISFFNCRICMSSCICLSLISSASFFSSSARIRSVSSSIGGVFSFTCSKEKVKM